MDSFLQEWICANKTELLGAILGIVYIFLSIKQRILTWPVGLLSSLFYIFVYSDSKIYAMMTLQGYYIIISIYGWYYWLKGNKSDESNTLKVQRLSIKSIIFLLIVSAFIFIILFFILTNFTDTDVPILDSLTTSLSIVATWMLARKYIENWLIWIFVDAVSIGLYFYKGLIPTVILFIVYTFMAFIGFLEWKRSINKPSNESYS